MEVISKLCSSRALEFSSHVKPCFIMGLGAVIFGNELPTVCVLT